MSQNEWKYGHGMSSSVTYLFVDVVVFESTVVHDGSVETVDVIAVARRWRIVFIQDTRE